MKSFLAFCCIVAAYQVSGQGFPGFGGSSPFGNPFGGSPVQFGGGQSHFGAPGLGGYGGNPFGGGHSGLLSSASSLSPSGFGGGSSSGFGGGSPSGFGGGSPSGFGGGFGGFGGSSPFGGQLSGFRSSGLGGSGLGFGSGYPGLGISRR